MIENLIQANAQRIFNETRDLISNKSRVLIAMAGPPATGKSTVAEATKDHFLSAGLTCAVVPMDGFHLDNRILDKRGIRDRKGSPQSFDVMGFKSLVERLKDNTEVIAPIFDRRQDISIAGAEIISAETKVVIVEGNYLLLDAPIWRDHSRYWDYSVFLSAPISELERRLKQRWNNHRKPQAEALAHIENNDLPNARLVLENRLDCDLEIPN